MPYKQTVHETSISSVDSDSDNDNTLTTSTETISDYFSYCCEVCQWSVETKLHKDQPIGGHGLTVEINKSKFSKTKYSCGRFVKGQWVFGGICCETQGTFLVALPNNKQDRQLTVNHSYNIVNPLTRAHTNNIENLWWQIKCQMNETYTRHANLTSHLCEYMWRHAHKGVDLFEAFMQNIGELYKPQK
uniref:ISXO2-like transposase domain-containing protein n=1 Tax=Octopus bimaculoides TaxID=37653 RepID=A0A0L8FP18_OCTBM